MAKTITIIGDSVPLPKSFIRRWRGKKVIVDATETMILIRSQVDVDSAWSELLRGPKGLMRPREINRQVQIVRAQRRAGRS